MQAWAVDLNEFACISMKHNHPETTVSFNHIFMYFVSFKSQPDFLVPSCALEYTAEDSQFIMLYGKMHYQFLKLDLSDFSFLMLDFLVGAK